MMFCPSLPSLSSPSQEYPFLRLHHLATLYVAAWMMYLCLPNRPCLCMVATARLHSYTSVSKPIASQVFPLLIGSLFVSLSVQVTRLYKKVFLLSSKWVMHRQPLLRMSWFYGWFDLFGKNTRRWRPARSWSYVESDSWFNGSFISSPFPLALLFPFALL